MKETFVLLSAAEIADELHCHKRSVLRWFYPGLQMPDKTYRFCPHERHGNQPLTTLEEVKEFLRQVAKAHGTSRRRLIVMEDAIIE